MYRLELFYVICDYWINISNMKEKDIKYRHNGTSSLATYSMDILVSYSCKSSCSLFAVNMGSAIVGLLTFLPNGSDHYLVFSVRTEKDFSWRFKLVF